MHQQKASSVPKTPPGVALISMQVQFCSFQFPWLWPLILYYISFLFHMRNPSLPSPLMWRWWHWYTYKWMKLMVTDDSISEVQLTGWGDLLWVVVRMGLGTDPGAWDTVLYPQTTASCRAQIWCPGRGLGWGNESIMIEVSDEGQEDRPGQFPLAGSWKQKILG